jgi:hypothetical protein
VGDEGIVCLSHLPQLTCLRIRKSTYNIDENKITNMGARAISRMHTLVYLDAC